MSERKYTGKISPEQKKAWQNVDPYYSQLDALKLDEADRMLIPAATATTAGVGLYNSFPDAYDQAANMLGVQRIPEGIAQPQDMAFISLLSEAAMRPGAEANLGQLQNLMNTRGIGSTPPKKQDINDFIEWTKRGLLQ